jgi:hypothetical protein
VTRPSWLPIAVIVAVVAGVAFALWLFSILAG